MFQQSKPKNCKSYKVSSNVVAEGINDTLITLNTLQLWRFLEWHTIEIHHNIESKECISVNIYTKSSEKKIHFYLHYTHNIKLLLFD